MNGGSGGGDLGNRCLHAPLAARSSGSWSKTRSDALGVPAPLSPLSVIAVVESIHGAPDQTYLSMAKG